MSNTNIFRQIVTGDQVEGAIVASLDMWVNGYLYELERDSGYEKGQIARPLGIVTASEFEKWPEDQLPVILVQSTGLAEPPKLRGEGVYDATWRVGVAPIVSDTDEVETRRLALTYAAAVRASLLQHATLKSSEYPDGFAHFVDWAGEDYTPIPFQQTRTVMAGHVLLNVGVESVTTKQAGPRDPSEFELSVDPGDWPEAVLPVIHAEPRTLTESLT